jgi:hypothetical protein
VSHWRSRAGDRPKACTFLRLAAEKTPSWRESRYYVLCTIFKAVANPTNPPEVITMSKGTDSKKETKKEPAKSMKEKKEAKKAKKEEKKGQGFRIS